MKVEIVIYTLNFVDIYSGWAEPIAIKNKASIWVLQGLIKIKNRLPYDLLGIDSDSGYEFINKPMLKWCQENNIKFTRGRGYYSNDNCYVEQKNYSVIRQIVGYFRYDTEEELYWLNRLYGFLRLYINFFQTVMKMTKKERIGSKVKKRYDDIKTPYKRLVESPYLTDSQKERLNKIYNELDIYELKREIIKCQKKLFEINKKKNKFLEEDFNGTA